MLQYIHEGHQGKERCLLWPKMTYDVQQLREVYGLPGVWKFLSQPLIGTTQELPHLNGTHWQQICFIGKGWTF